MAEVEKISCQKRDIKTRGFLNELKRSGLVPGTVYGKGIDNQAISLASKQLSRIFQVHGSRGLFSLEIEGSSGLMVVVREVQRHPITGQLIHVDFWEVRLDEKINSTVGISIIGEEEIMKKGGILQSGAKEIEVSSLPQDIPETLVYDIAALEIGDKVTVADLQVPAGVEILTSLEAMVATVLAPAKPDEEETEEEGEATEAEETEATEG
ncbi:MAG: 50S ribosomal protein L25 [Syntrophomonadaceae bacterium]|nr:50S ribosomal protein L25 [Syntrophomonadaceae bacterium]MDD3272263.1 50S ribosomal protein L25 [Syntrophomonadaceae bacterium]MDD4563068.1 50S ribosomal protein L25 [Syntrophomonadaceae bacterium]